MLLKVNYSYDFVQVHCDIIALFFFPLYRKDNRPLWDKYKNNLLFTSNTCIEKKGRAALTLMAVSVTKRQNVGLTGG